MQRLRMQIQGPFAILGSAVEGFKERAGLALYPLESTPPDLAYNYADGTTGLRARGKLLERRIPKSSRLRTQRDEICIPSAIR